MLRIVEFSKSTSAHIKQHDNCVLNINFLIIRLSRGVVENRLHGTFFKNRYAVNVAVTLLMIFARVNELRQLSCLTF